MGCFDGTCVFSRTAIRSGDEVLMVVLHREGQKRWDTYELIKECHSPSPFRFLGLGPYNGYGTIDEYTQDDVGDWWDYQFLVHQSVAEGLLHKSLVPSDLFRSRCH